MPSVQKNVPARRRAVRRSRPVESFADWMSRIDAEVEEAARAVAHEPPPVPYAHLHPAQQRILEMLTKHLLGLPLLRRGEDCFTKQEYVPVNMLLTNLYTLKYGPGKGILSAIPREEMKNFEWILRNCAGYPDQHRSIGDGKRASVGRYRLSRRKTNRGGRRVGPVENDAPE